jgi:hypothetical protein
MNAYDEKSLLYAKKSEKNKIKTIEYYRNLLKLAYVQGANELNSSVKNYKIMLYKLKRI